MLWSCISSPCAGPTSPPPLTHGVLRPLYQDPRAFRRAAAVSVLPVVLLLTEAFPEYLHTPLPVFPTTSRFAAA